MTLDILSGDYEGFYSYGSAGNGDHIMKASLSFSESGHVIGSGIDDIDSFTLKGHFDMDTLTVTLTKSYPSHKVKYTGVIEHNHNLISISGIWSIASIIHSKGGFTLRKSEISDSILRDIDMIEKSLRQSLEKIEGISIRLLDEL